MRAANKSVVTEIEIEAPPDVPAIRVRTPGGENRSGYRQMINEPPVEPRKFYIDGGEVEVIGHLVYDLDTDGKKLQVVRYTDYSGRAVRTLYPTRDACNRPGPTPTPAPRCCAS
jgi:type I restriction enzyme R subunit